MHTKIFFQITFFIIFLLILCSGCNLAISLIDSAIEPSKTTQPGSSPTPTPMGGTGDFTIQYYYDVSLTTPMGDNPYLGIGTYYLEIITGETIPWNPQITIDAEGFMNDVTDEPTVSLGGNIYMYTRNISYDVPAMGSLVESITINGSDPSNRDIKAAYIDTVPPDGSILINCGEIAVNILSVVLYFTENDSGSGTTEIMVSNYVDFSGAIWEPYCSSKTWCLDSGEGEKDVYVKFRDFVMNESAPYSDSIFYDVTSPAGSLIVEGGDIFTSSTTVNLDITFNDFEGSGVVSMIISNYADFTGASWEPYNPSTPWIIDPSNGSKDIYMRLGDMADNESAVIIGSIILDTEAPTGYIYINSDASSTSTETVTLNINAIDAGVVSEMMISNHSDFSGASWVSYATTSVWTLLSGDGTKEVFIKFRDIVMNVSTTYSDTIQLIKG